MNSLTPWRTLEAWKRSKRQSRQTGRNSARCQYDNQLKKCRRTEPASYDVFANTQDQLYIGATKENSRTNVAVNATAGEVVVHQGQVAFAMFHANSGGRTCSYSDCYGGNTISYLESKVEPDQEALRKMPRGTTDTVIDPKAFAQAAKKQGINFSDSVVTEIQVSSRNDSERADEITIRGPTSSAVIPEDVYYKLRVHFQIPTSYMEDAYPNEKGQLVVTSYGWGHGVGISQEGARLQAQRRINYQDIINFYYTNCSVLDLRKIIPGSI